MTVLTAPEIIDIDRESLTDWIVIGKHGLIIEGRGRRGLLLPQVPEELYLKCIQMVVSDNLDYVPPYGTGGSLYIRPVMFGTSPQIGVNASFEYELIIMVMPAASGPRSVNCWKNHSTGTRNTNTRATFKISVSLV